MQQIDTIQQTQHTENIQPVTHDTAPVRYVKPVTYTAVPDILLLPTDTVVEQVADNNDYLMMCNDSLFQQYADRPVRYRESMFADNGRSMSNPTPNLRHTDPAIGWVFGTIVLLFALMSIYLNSQRFKLRDIFLSLFGKRVLERVFRESNLKPRTLLPMTGIYLTSLSLIAVNLEMSYGGHSIGYTSWQLFLIILAGLVTFILLKTGFTRLLGNIFNDNESVTLYLSNNYLFYFVGGIVTLPVSLMLYYLPGNTSILTKLTLIFIAILFIIRILRGMQLILTNSKKSYLYLFYYLCILEIVPILIITKVLFY